MGVLKLTPEEFQHIKYIPKELSNFWKCYFAGLSISLNKLFFKYTCDNISVRYLHRDIVKGKDYFEAISGNSVIQPFNISPTGGFGFLFVTDDLANYFLNSILGGVQEESEEVSHLITSTDLKLLDNILDDILVVLLMQMKEKNKGIEFQKIGNEDSSVLTQINAADQIISVQQFLVVTNSNSFVFDIAFTNRVLEEFVLI